MFKEHSTEKLIEFIQTLPQKEQKAIVEKLSSAKPTKKLSKKEKNTQRILKGIAEGLREIKEAKRTGKKMKTLEEFLNEV